jgi:hypothetical protein
MEIERKTARRESFSKTVSITATGKNKSGFFKNDFLLLKNHPILCFNYDLTWIIHKFLPTSTRGWRRLSAGGSSMLAKEKSPLPVGTSPF